jgi:endogenous inhibitor of DNA gyrase (YacG/DUF329 family)
MTRAFKSHKCENIIFCTADAEKDKYGNYRRYCSEECKKIGIQFKFSDTYLTKDTDAILKKRKATVTAKYGVDNVSKTKAVKDQLKITTKATADARTAATKKTNLANWGVESTNSLQSVKNAKKSTFQKKYGVDHQLKIPSVSASVSKKNTDNATERLTEAKKTKLKEYGDENYNNRDKYKETCIEKFGVENPSQNAEVHAKKMKSEYRNKEFTFPSGKRVMVMGYEDKAISELLKTYSEIDIITETTLIPTIPYIGTDNKTHVYFPDIYIPKDKLFIEVKSQYTYDGFIGWYETNKLKESACIKAGYNFKFMIMSKK